MFSFSDLKDGVTVTARCGKGLSRDAIKWSDWHEFKLRVRFNDQGNPNYFTPVDLLWAEYIPESDFIEIKEGLVLFQHEDYWFQIKE